MFGNANALRLHHKGFVLSTGATYRFSVLNRLSLCLSPYALPICNEETVLGFPFVCAGFDRFRGFLLLTGFPYLFPIS